MRCSLVLGPGEDFSRRSLFDDKAVGCNKPATEGARYIAEFVENAKKSGLVASLIEKHKVKGLSVAPPA